MIYSSESEDLTTGGFLPDVEFEVVGLSIQATVPNPMGMQFYKGRMVAEKLADHTLIDTGWLNTDYIGGPLTLTNGFYHMAIAGLDSVTTYRVHVEFNDQNDA